MKKILTVITVLLAVFTLNAEAKTELDSNSSVVIVERLSGGKFKDDLEIVNKSFKDNVSVKIYIKSDGFWEYVDNVSFYHFDDFVKIQSKKFPSKIKSKEITQIAIESSTSDVYEIKGSIIRDNAVIEIRDEGTNLKKSVVPDFDEPNAYLFDGRTAYEEFDENLKIRNKTTLKGISFKVSVYDKNTQSWIYYGQAEVNGKNDETKVKSKLKLGDYRYFAVESLNGEDFNYMPVPEDDDLIINVSL